MPTSSSILTSAMTVTGADVPEDLFGRILDFLDIEIIPPYLAVASPNGTHKFRMNELTNCTLTCRYWARRCQPRIFEHIHLQFKADLDQLLALLESPLTRISNYVKHLYLNQKTSDPMPWIHLVPLRLVPKLSLSPTIKLIFQGGWRESDTKRFGHLRSVHYMLPSARPEFSSHISHLELCKLQFRCFEDIYHLVGELPSLRTLECWEVKWSSVVPDNYVIPVCPPSLDRVIMYRCTENAVGVLFLLGRRRKIPRNEAVLHFCLDRNQRLVTSQLIRNVAGVISGTAFDMKCTIEKVDDVYRE